MTVELDRVCPVDGCGFDTSQDRYAIFCPEHGKELIYPPCPECKAGIDWDEYGDAKFCPYCGAKLSPDEDNGGP